MFKKIKQFLNEVNAKQQNREEIYESVNCPYCKKHYTSQEIFNSETIMKEETIKDCSVIVCDCRGLFGIKISKYYEPSYCQIKTSFKILGDISSELSGRN